MMSQFKLRLLLLLGSAALLRADSPRPGGVWDVVSVPPMTTSIYVGTVTLVPGPFLRKGEGYYATYEAKVWPWFFWGENGTVSIKFSEADLARVSKGESVDFAGGGYNQKHRPRTVTGRVQPADAVSGKIKIRINVDNVTLVFNGTYRFANVP